MLTLVATYLVSNYLFTTYEGPGYLVFLVHTK